MNEQEGYTLVELLLAISILGIIIVMFFNFILSYQQTLLLLENKVVANNLARLKIEEFRDGRLNTKVAGKEIEFQQEEFADYFYKVEVIRRRAGLKEVKIKILYFETEIFSLSTFV